VLKRHLPRHCFCAVMSFETTLQFLLCSVTLQCHRMWFVVRITVQKGHSGLGSLSITAEWVALVNPVRKRLMTTCSRLVIVLVFVFIMCCGLRFFMVVVEFSHFSCCSCSCFFLSMLSSPVGDMFQCGEFLCSVLLFLRHRLLCFQVTRNP
jgi:hypothetical protein